LSSKQTGACVTNVARLLLLSTITVLFASGCGGDATERTSGPALSRSPKKDYTRVRISVEQVKPPDGVTWFRDGQVSLAGVGDQIEYWEALYSAYLLEDIGTVCEAWIKALDHLKQVARDYRKTSFTSTMAPAISMGLTDAYAILLKIPESDCW